MTKALKQVRQEAFIKDLTLREMILNIVRV